MLRFKLALLGSSLAVTVGVCAPASAQTAPAAAETDVEAVVVTGSRLTNTGFVAPTPVTTIGSDQIERRAPSAVNELLADIPSFRPTNGPSQAQRLVGAGQGLSSADLRGLGASRTLVLINGRRVVGQSPTGTVDTSIIPSGLIDRLEVVTGGASAAYGSDAVAGVVNFIMKDRIDGFNGSIQVGRSQRGDNDEIGGTLNWGETFAGGKGKVVLGADYNRTDGVGNIYQRKRTAVEPGNSANPIPFGANRPAGVPAQGFLTNVEFSTLTKGSVINAARTTTGGASTALNQLAFNADGSSYILQRGTVYGNLMAGVNTNYGSGPMSNWNLRTPNQREAYMGIVNYEITPDLNAFFEVNFGKTKVEAESSFHTQPGTIVFRDNPFIPADVRARMVALNINEITIGRVDTDWRGSLTDNRVDTLRFAAGLAGKVFGDWTWDVYLQHGKTIGHNNLYHTKESNLLAAEYVVTGPNGQPVCGPLATNPNFAPNRLTALIDPSKVLPGCVPFNPFGIGRNSQAAIDYVSGWQYTKIEIWQQVAAANIAGDLFSLPAGAVSIATGIEARRNELNQTADPLQIRAIYGNGNQQTYSGEQEVLEGYIEAGIPILRDVAFAKSLDLNGAVRRTHYSDSGSVTTWKAGFSFEPNDSIRLRATQSRDIRAPNLVELYNVGGSMAAANFIANPFNGVLGRLTTTNRGNPNLKPEIADTFTMGLVLQPTWEWANGFRASIDYFNIKVSEVIAAAAAQDILTGCLAGIQAYCGQIEFDSTAFGIRNVNNAPLNQAALKTNGFDFEVAYRVPLDNFNLPGRLDIRALATWTRKLERTDRAGTVLTTTDYAGSLTNIGVPEWSGVVNLNYALGGFTAGLQTRLFSASIRDPQLIGPDKPGYNPALPNSVNINRFPSVPYYNVNAAYDFMVEGHRLQVFGLINNLFDRQAPVLSLAALNTGGNPYDYIGRTFKMGMRFAW
jgi:outer membrane receptor protein involved in Fe transport